ncbi:MAG: response regulator [Anaerolineaceae bacterium]|nr:response regulator [Anaerolineaceae bacterium]
MGKARLLVVEDDQDISSMLKIYFSSQGYEVDLALRGELALEKTRMTMPHLIVLDIMLPDIDGYEVCKRLRSNSRTSHIPVIFLTQKDERSDKLQGLELGADDYITKPFDIEELRLRVQNAIARAERESLTDAQSGLPSGKLIEDQLRKIIREKDWSFVDIRLNNFEFFKEVYGFIAANDVLRYTGMLMGEVLDNFGTEFDFLGHAGGNNFVMITRVLQSSDVTDQIIKKFNETIPTHYNFMDRQQGFILAKNEKGEKIKYPLMTISIGVVSPKTHQFSDIREITELAAEARRMESVD